MKIHKAVLVVALLASIGIVGFLLPVRAWFEEFEAYVHSLGAIGPVIYALGYVVLTVLLFPASFVTLGAGTLFGLKTGLFVALVGALIIIALLARYLPRTSFYRRFALIDSSPSGPSLTGAPRHFATALALAPGQRIRVVRVDGLTLEVEGA